MDLTGAIKSRRKRMTYLCLFLTGFTTSAYSQAVGNGNIEARFGVDGDLTADTTLFGAARNGGNGSDDWFKYKTGVGIGIIDTNGAAAYRKLMQASLANRQHLVFSKGMSVPKLTRSGNAILIDALYSKDYFDDDSTVVIGKTGGGSPKSADDPSTWIIGYGTITPSKDDINEFYSHIRRKGITVFDSLFFIFGVSMHETSGNKNVSAELFVNDVSLNRVTGHLNQPGPDGGRVAWRFDNTGKVTRIGDMVISMSYNPSGGFTIEPRIWVSDSFTTGGILGINPANFDWGTQFDPMTGGGTFGFQDILPNGGTTNYAHGVANNTDTTIASPWGNIDQAAPHNFMNHFDPNQFIEVSLNLTALGVDPSLFTTMDPCSVPYRSIVFKSRTSSAFNSGIQDFAGPYPFWRYPRVISSIKGTDTLNCRVTSGSIFADSAYSLAWYKWTGTAGGNITAYNADSTVIDYNKPGIYILESAPLRGCWTLKDSVEILGDYAHPVATAFAYDTLLDGTNPIVRLYGGDSLASIAATYSPVFGNSQGIMWQWSGKNSFISQLKNPSTSDSGNYSLIVTERRNGCTDTAYTTLIQLPLTWGNLQCSQSPNGAQLQWYTLQETETDYFKILKLENEKYTQIGTVPAAVNSQQPVFYQYFVEGEMGESGIYQIQLVNKNLSIENGPVCRTNADNQKPVTVEFEYGPNPVTDKLIVYNQSESEISQIEVFNSTGQKMEVAVILSDDTEFTLDFHMLPAGIYTLRYKCGDTRMNHKIVKY